MTDLSKLDDEALLQRQKQLESEIDANEQEIRLWQADLDKVYDEIDRRTQA